MDEFSHVDEDGVGMVDVGDKPDAARRSVATGEIALDPETVRAIEADETPKGDVLTTARIAAIQAVKRTWDDVPLCHPIDIDDVTVEFEVREAAVAASVAVRSTGKTGVEMEALNGVTRALLTVWDMVKSAEKDDDGEYPTTRIRDVGVATKEKVVLGEGSADGDERGADE